MKILSEEEFADRCQAVNEALQIFGHMTDNDITRAFMAYQLVLAERGRKAMLTTEKHGNRAPTFLDQYERPKCPDCGADMMIRRVPENDENVKAQFVCSNPECDLVLDSPKTIQEITQELESKEKNDAGSV